MRHFYARSFIFYFITVVGLRPCPTFVSIPWHYSISYLYRSVLLCYDVHYFAEIMFLPQLRTCVIGVQGYLHPKLTYLYNRSTMISSPEIKVLV